MRSFKLWLILGILFYPVTHLFKKPILFPFYGKGRDYGDFRIALNLQADFDVATAIVSALLIGIGLIIWFRNRRTQSE